MIAMADSLHIHSPPDPEVTGETKETRDLDGPSQKRRLPLTAASAKTTC